MKSTQQLFAANPMVAPFGRHFWEAQERMLSEAEDFTSAWFKRRHQAAAAALKAQEKVNDGGPSNPAVLLEVMSEWQKGSMERMTDDARECGEMLGRCANLLLRTEVETVEEVSDKVKKTTKTADAQPV